MNVPYVNLAAQHSPIKDELLAAVSRVMDHGMFILGDEVAEFEERFAKLCGVKYTVGVNSGTDALILALEALGIGPGDEVITVANSFLASTSCITLVGASPVLIDVKDDLNIDPSLIEAAITPATKAILPVHLTGRPADMDSIMSVAQQHGLHVVEDCAQAVGAKYKSQDVGSFGTAGCFSLHPLKTLNACGDGGIITTDDPELYQQFRYLRNHGLKTREDCIMWSHNTRLDTIQAAMLLVKMNYLDEWTEKRRANARYFQESLARVEQIELPQDQPHELAVYHTFIIQTDQRDALKAHLAEDGIGTVISYPTPIHLQEAAAGLSYPVGSFPVTERQADRMLNLPVYSELEEQQLAHVVDSIKQFFGNGR
ncbi:MAG: DegT/DnrJ/EryC1/StrS family aminotransferase [SAR202 cluster bacterium]|nr:DegT/DnrJ/EryC1/StrS family aminotransferase [SAR202 cluster bacterium]